MEPLLDARNEALWKQVCERFTVKIQPDKEYACHAQGDEVTFYIDVNNTIIDSFTHEMLHVLLRVKGIFLSASFKLTVNGSNILRTLFCESLLEHVGNSLEHVQMLPIYLEMGFEREKFLRDYHEHKCSDYELTMIKRYYRNGKKINLSIVEQYLGKVFAILADPNPEFDYSSHKSQLKKLDPHLFNITENLFNKWLKTDIMKGDAMGETYRPLVATYYQGLKQWLTLNKVTA